MSIFDELNELKNVILPCILVFVVLSALFFLVPFSKPVSVYVFEMLKGDLLTEQVKLITLNPLNAFLAQLGISFFLAFIFGFPYYLYKIMNYLSPAFYDKEKKAVLKVLLPSFLLFALGCLFSYFFLIPPTFKILYSYAIRLGAETFFSINEFIFTVLALVLASGVIFLLPIFMILLSKLSLIEAGFWKRNWRTAILISLIFSAIITPDGTGITMLILSLPITGLYFLGMILA